MGEEEDQKKARQTAVRMLAYRGRSKQELTEKLRGKGFSPEAVDQAIAYVISCGYVDDRSLAHDVADSLFTHKGWGFGRIAVVLRSRGIPPDVVDDTLSSLKQTHSEEETASALLLRRFPYINFRTASPGEKRRVANFLQRRGFSWDTINRVMTS